MARPRRVSDEQLFETARAVFLAKGTSAPLSAVAARLGLSTPAVLHRVGSKAALLSRALQSPLPPALARLGGPPGPEHRRELETVLLELLAGLEGVVPSLVVRRAGGHVTSGSTAPTVALRRALSRWLRQVRTAVPAEVAAEALLGALEARAFNRCVGGPALTPGSDRAFVRRLVEALVLP